MWLPLQNFWCEKPTSFFRKRAFFKEINRVWNLRIALKFGQKTLKITIYKKKKLCEGIPFFEIGKILISKLDRKIAKQQIAISKNPRTILKSNPSGLELCRNLIVRSVLIPDFLEETSSNWNFCASVGLRLDQAKKNVFFLIAHFITLPPIHSLW